MPRTGRPPLTEAVIRERVADYCARYDVGLAETGFPVYPAGLRETRQHREWITLFKVFRRLRDRSQPSKSPDPNVAGNCPICLQPRPKPGKPHRQCAEVVEFIHELGVPGLERIRAAAFPDDPRPPGRTAAVPKRKA